MPFFSVIIPVYNRYEQTARAVESVLAQDFTDYELIVVDDGSTDRTGEIGAVFAGKIRYIKQPNLGVSAARNRGIKLSRSPHIAFLDSDDIWDPRKLSSHRMFIEQHPEIKIHQCDDIWIRNGRRVNMSSRYIKGEGDIFSDSLQICSISPSSVCISRDLFEIYGIFDEKMRVCEDYDLWLRITPFEHTGLIKEKLTTRFSGHEGQLSAAYWGMDRFRVYSILKLLDESGDKLTEGRKISALDCALTKISILKKGSDKRNNTGLSRVLEKISIALMDGCCTRKYYQSLLEI